MGGSINFIGAKLKKEKKHLPSPLSLLSLSSHVTHLSILFVFTSFLLFSLSQRSISRPQQRILLFLRGTETLIQTPNYEQRV